MTTDDLRTYTVSERSEGYSDGYAAGLRWGKRDGDRIAAETLRELHRAQAERDRLAAVVARVEALNAPRTVQVITGDCSTEECGHEDECPTAPFQQCVECDRIADEVDTYYSERGIAVTGWPCPTVAAIERTDS